MTICIQDVPEEHLFVTFQGMERTELNGEPGFRFPEPRHFPCVVITDELFTDKKYCLLVGESPDETYMACGVVINDKPIHPDSYIHKWLVLTNNENEVKP